jgi:hypothetical protein
MSGFDRSAEYPPENGERGRIARGKVGMAGRIRVVDFAVPTARRQRLAQDRTTRAVKSRRGAEVRIQPDRSR